MVAPTRSWSNFNRVDGRRNKRQQVLESVAGAAEHDDPELSFAEILLELKVPISRDENSETGGLGCVEQLSVLQPGPGLLLAVRMSCPLRRGANCRGMLIEQNAHARLPLMGGFQRRDGLLP